MGIYFFFFFKLSLFCRVANIPKWSVLLSAASVVHGLTHVLFE